MFIFSTSARKVLLLTIASTFFILWVPHQTGATTDALEHDKQQVEINMKEAKEAVEAFYQAITTQNFGVAEKIYTIPSLGIESYDPVLSDFSTPPSKLLFG
ncbi:hypothetical protein [Sporosarcina sp. FSL K6-1508]|uniref:hypothetical protein n=1 Tax=Sporosarcina sp. FSL K6-1508 TaxID=2921553 RepID=UPI0030FAF7DB